MLRNSVLSGPSDLIHLFDVFDCACLGLEHSNLAPKTVLVRVEKWGFVLTVPLVTFSGRHSWSSRAALTHSRSLRSSTNPLRLPDT